MHWSQVGVWLHASVRRRRCRAGRPLRDCAHDWGRPNRGYALASPLARLEGSAAAFVRKLRAHKVGVGSALARLHRKESAKLYRSSEHALLTQEHGGVQLRHKDEVPRRIAELNKLQDELDGRHHGNGGARPSGYERRRLAPLAPSSSSLSPQVANEARVVATDAVLSVSTSLPDALAWALKLALRPPYSHHMASAAAACFLASLAPARQARRSVDESRRRRRSPPQQCEL